MRKGDTPASTTDCTTKLAAIQIAATATMYVKPKPHLQTLLFMMSFQANSKSKLAHKPFLRFLTGTQFQNFLGRRNLVGLGVSCLC